MKRFRKCIEAIADSVKANDPAPKCYRVWYRCPFCDYRAEMYIERGKGIGCCPLCELDPSSTPTEEELAAAKARAKEYEKENQALLDAFLKAIKG